MLFAFAIGFETARALERSRRSLVDVDARYSTAVPALETLPVAEAPSCPILQALALGKALVTKGEHPRAREVLAHAAKLEKKQADPHIELTRSYIATGERANAIKSANKAVKLAPESSQAYNTLGRAELLRHNYENAVEAFRQATELNEGNVWAWNNLGFTYLTLKKYDDAITALVEATTRKGAESYMFNNLGTAYEHTDQLDEAREAYDKGGELGSVAAASSRKRLEGVDTVVVMTSEAAKPDTTVEKMIDALDEKVENCGRDLRAQRAMPEMPVVTEEPKPSTRKSSRRRSRSRRSRRRSRTRSTRRSKRSTTRRHRRRSRSRDEA